MFSVYFFNHHEAHFYKTYTSKRAAELAVQCLSIERIVAWIEES